jgi:hypothetical protein
MKRMSGVKSGRRSRMSGDLVIGSSTVLDHYILGLLRLPVAKETIIMLMMLRLSEMLLQQVRMMLVVAWLIAHRFVLFCETSSRV